MSNTQKIENPKLVRKSAPRSRVPKRRPTRRQSDRKEATQTAILLAARDVFSTQGFEHAKTSDIVLQAGVAEGTLFLHFESKKGVLAAIMNGVFDEMLYGADKIRAQQQDELLALKQLTRHYIDILEKNWAVAKVFGAYGRYSEGDFHDAFYRRNRDFTGVFLSLFDSLKEQGRVRKTLSSRVLRDMLFGGIEHFAISHFPLSRKDLKAPSETDLFLEDLWSLLLEGAAPKADENEKTEPTLATLEHKLDDVLFALNKK